MCIGGRIVGIHVLILSYYDHAHGIQNLYSVTPDLQVKSAHCCFLMERALQKCLSVLDILANSAQNKLFNHPYLTEDAKITIDILSSIIHALLSTVSGWVKKRSGWRERGKRWLDRSATGPWGWIEWMSPPSCLAIRSGGGIFCISHWMHLLGELYSKALEVYRSNRMAHV